MAAAAVALPLFTSACGGSSDSEVPRVASTKSSGTSTSSSSESSKGDPAAYSACMRKHGVPNFPDPDSSGGIKLTFGQTKDGKKTGVDTNSPQYESAQKACRSLRPNGGRPSPQAQAKEVQSALAFARCMRSHGVPKFPDPEIRPDGGMLQTLGSEDVNTESPQFKNAQQTCQKLVPDGPSTDAAGPPPSGDGGTP
jgi:hypothetical protein